MKSFDTRILHVVKVSVSMLPILFVASASLRAAEFQGASAVLKVVAQQNASTNTIVEESADSILRKDLKDFQKNVGTMAPVEAAAGWLNLVDRHAKLAADETSAFDESIIPITSEEIMAALPPPKVWETLAQAIRARPAAKEDGALRESGLRLLAATLTGDAEERKKEIAALQERAEKADPQTVFVYRDILTRIRQVMLSSLDDPALVIQSLEQELAGAKADGRQRLAIPNLVSLAGAEKAEAFLRKALQAENVTLRFDDQNETLRLAQRLALEMVDTLKKPHWELVNSLDSVELYEALDKRFGQETVKESAELPAGLENLPDLSAFSNLSRDGAKGGAQTYYMLGLISKQRAKDAVAVAQKLGKQSQVYLPVDALKAMERAGYTKALDDFFFELLSQDPTLPFWKDYVPLAAKAGKTDRMLTLARATAARDDLSKAKKSVIDQTLFRALLAAGQTEEGVNEMRRLIKEDASPRSYQEENPAQLNLMLARIGILLEKPDWIEEGIRGAKNALDKPAPKNSYLSMSELVAPALADLLVELNRGPEAEAVLTEVLAKAVQKKEGAQSYSWRERGDAPSYLAALARVYHKSGRPDDVLALLENAPYWQAKDLAELDAADHGFELPGLNQLHNAPTPLPVDYVAANALVALGRKDEARVILLDLLNRKPGFDPAYALLISLEDAGAIKTFDQLFARDQFEERPLIWKAELLRRQNKLEQAESTVRRAISIDPSDGEQGPNDRLRAYAVLADIREARGDKKEADFFRGAVNAIRLSEKADQFYTAGLLKRAIQMYEDSLKLFADAYCIQSRLAIQLSELGLHQEAEAHYRRAYELMPDSFGRVESHCFGCERAFDGQRAQSLAEKIFTDLAKKTPDKPQVHYLLGYLREEQGHHAEALPHFQKAVELDPEYLNAWKKLQELGREIHLPAEQNNRIVFNILKLDPLSRHVQPMFNKVTDLAGLWNAVAGGLALRLEPATHLLPLPASKSAMEKKESEEKTPEQKYASIYRQMFENRDSLSPASAVGRTPFVQIASGMIAGRNSRYSDF